MSEDIKGLGTPPDIETSLRNPINEHGYRNRYNKVLSERAMSVILDVLVDDPNKETKEKTLRSLFEGENGSTIIEGNTVKALSEAGLLKVRSVTGRKDSDMENENGWWERKRMKEWEKERGHEMWGVVEEYWVELPGKEADAPVTTQLKLAAKQLPLKGETNRYGGPMYGEVDYNKWTLTRTAY